MKRLIIVDNKYLKNKILEFDILNIGDIFLISKEIEKLIENDEKIVHVGHCKIFESAKIQNINPKDFDIDNFSPLDTLIITNPIILSNIFSDYKYYLRNIAKKLKNQFIFTMPSFGKTDEIEVYWDTGFSYPEVDNEKYSRWFTSRTDKVGRIYIYNHSKKPKRVIINFEIFTLDRSSTVEISYFNSKDKVSKMYEVNNDLINFNENVLLYPGNNEIEIKYFGDLYIRTEGDIRPLLFKVIDLHIEGDYSKSGNEAYYQITNDYFLDYFEDEDRIRSCLHASGFYDVISRESIENRELLKSKYTRYYVCDLLYREVEYYNRNYRNESKYLNLFFAKRNGILNE